MITETLDAANREDEVLNGLNACSFMAEDIGLEDGSVIRPCVAILFRDGCQSGFSVLGRDPAAFIISVQLRWLGFDRNETSRLLSHWNKRNRPNLTDRQLDKIVDNVYKKTDPHKYSCNHHSLAATCIGQENCPWAKRGKGINRNKSLQSAFMAKGWMKVLSNNAKLIYLVVLPIIEGRRQVGTGGRIYIGYRELAEALGWPSHSSIGRYLRELAGFCLIKYKTGDPLRKNHKATEVTRSIPVPDVPELYRNKLQSKRSSLCSR